MATVQSSPNKPRPENWIIRDIADDLRRIEFNYEREGSGPGSRFEGMLLEDVQAEYVVMRRVLPWLNRLSLMQNPGLPPDEANALRLLLVRKGS